MPRDPNTIPSERPHFAPDAPNPQTSIEPNNASQLQPALPSTQDPPLRKTITTFLVSLSKTLAFSLPFLLIILTVIAGRREILQIRVLSVPRSLQERGYTTDTMAHLIADRLHLLRQTTTDPSSRPPAILPYLDPLDITVANVRVPVTALRDLATAICGRLTTADLFFLAETVANDASCSASSRITRGSTQLTTARSFSCAEPPSSVVRLAAVEVLQSIDPLFHSYLLFTSNQTDEALAVIKAYLGPTEGDTRRKLIALSVTGYGLYRARRLVEAEATFQEILKIDSRCALAYYHWGAGLDESGQPEAAISKYEAAAGIDPTLWQVYFNWGKTLLDLGAPREASEKFQRAAEINPGVSWTYDLWGRAIGRSGDCRAALSKFYHAAQLEPLATSPYIGAGNCLRVLALPREAAKMYERAVEINPRSAVAFFNLGQTCMDRGLFEEAARNYERVVALGARGVRAAEAYNNWGSALAMLKRWSEAADRFSMAVLRDETYPWAYRNWALALRTLGRHRAARGVLEKARRLGVGVSVPTTRWMFSNMPKSWEVLGGGEGVP